MGWFSKRRLQRDRAMQDALKQKLDGRELQYVIRRSIDENGSPTETVLGKSGRFIYAGGHLSIIAGEAEVFRNESPETVTCGELMALNGVMIQGYNLLTARPDTIVAYYSYYRK